MVIGTKKRTDLSTNQPIKGSCTASQSLMNNNIMPKSASDIPWFVA
ncbi:hypothetical protein A11S_1906 [Micavibrio aeruginosavorus EPB]|uniref:Uncharacterized protein n=1 Tax=Micavibrio aeruginosavorus EPB TaxID=349215 RepID=M4VH45_9BACT|nr:hypothetical protein A11S_1906 [Micavibrio aeruginosavorus EPB]